MNGSGHSITRSEALASGCVGGQMRKLMGGGTEEQLLWGRTTTTTTITTATSTVMSNERSNFNAEKQTRCRGRIESWDLSRTHRSVGPSCCCYCQAHTHNAVMFSLLGNIFQLTSRYNEFQPTEQKPIPRILFWYCTRTPLWTFSHLCISRISSIFIEAISPQKP